MSDNTDNQTTSELLEIKIVGARENNLKNIDLVLPREKLVVITGVSGSGKSSLAFDTVYAEGQRRYIECLSSYAKQFMGMMKKPDVDSVEGLSPAISIEQKTISNNPRSTVGTATEIYDYLRLFYAKIGVQYCIECNVPVVKKSIDQIIKEIFEEFYGKHILILAPLVTARKGHYKELFATLISQGFSRTRVDGHVIKLTPNMQLERYKTHDIEIVIDKCKVDSDRERRIENSCELAINRGDGTLMILELEDELQDESNPMVAHSSKNELKHFNINNSCPICKMAYKPLSPNMFSFNSPYGACTHCNGIGEVEDFSIDLLIPDKSISVLSGAIQFIGKYQKTWLWSQLEHYATEHEIDLSIPVQEMSLEQFNMLIYGDETNIFPTKKKSNIDGFLPNLRSLYNNAFSLSQQRELDVYRLREQCPQCHGSRLKSASNSVKIYNNSIYDIIKLDISETSKYFKTLAKKINSTEKKIVGGIIDEVQQRLSFLQNVGLSYISLSRPMGTLSGGESQRIRLASQIGSQLVGITYVLDEPSIGLHQRDNNKLIESLKQLRDIGNTVIVVEHDKAMIEQSDFVVDFGPGAGCEGGKVNFATTSNKLNTLSKDILKKSLTAQYLSGDKQVKSRDIFRKPNLEKILELRGATGNNLKSVSLRIPLGLFVCITGVSGSGKSSLINDTLYPLLANKLHNAKHKILSYSELNGIEHIDKVIEVDQQPIGRTPRSNPATYTKMFDIVRNYYANLPESAIRGYKPGRFSFNVVSGRCGDCEGAGMKKLEMNFLPDVYVTCDTCNGKRYNEETLQVKFKGKSISDVLEMTVSEALIFFENIPNLRNKLQILNDVGLGYIKLGQQAPTLSGGEAQRVKLAAELARPATGKTLFLLDEPTTGLHFEDIRLLLVLLQKLVDKGNTVVVIEHNLDLIKCADWIIDLGPDGGAGGGKIVAEGSPIEISKNKNSITGKYLFEEL